MILALLNADISLFRLQTFSKTIMKLWTYSYVALSAMFTSRCFATTTLPSSAFPSSMIEFSSTFDQPPPPLVSTEYTANFLQHKWYGFSQSHPHTS